MSKILKKLKKLIKKIKIKKIFKFCIYIIICLCFLVLAAEFALRYILPLPSIKTKILNQISSAVGGDLKAGEISAGLFNLEIDNIVLDLPKGNLFTCKSIKIRQNPFKLLKGQIVVRNIYIEEPLFQIIRYKDGSFNFETLINDSLEEKNQTEEENSGTPVDLTIRNFNLNNANIIYLDLKDNIKAEAEKLNLSVYKFSFSKPFRVELSLNPYFEQEDISLKDFKVALAANVNLQNFDLKEASLDLKQFLISYKDTLLKTKAQVNNFGEPVVNFDIELKDFSEETLSAFAKTESFNIESLKVKGDLIYNIQKAKLYLNNFIVKLLDTDLYLSGKFDFAKDFAAWGKANLTSVLDSLEEISPLVKAYKPAGQLTADLEFAWPLTLKGKIDLKDVGFFVEQAGAFKDLNTSVKVNSIDNVNIAQLKAELNKNPFEAKANYVKNKDFADISFDFKADKLYIIDSSKDAQNQEESKTSPQETTSAQEENKTAQTPAEKEFFVPINIDAKVDVKKFDVPFLRGNDLLFTANAKNLTAQMDKTHGTFNLTMKDGLIKDVYTLSDANALTKVMFMSLGIVSKVINTLNVLDLLSGIGKMLGGSKEEEDEAIAHQEIKGKLDFDSFETKVDFNQGLATLEKCSFVSDLFSFRVNGNINFDSRNIKLSVDSAPGKHQDDGIMPLNIAVGGTIEEPQGSLSVISSVTTLVSNTITNNPVSNMLKGTFGKLFGTKQGKEKSKETSSIKSTDETLPNENSALQEEAGRADTANLPQNQAEQN